MNKRVLPKLRSLPETFRFDRESPELTEIKNMLRGGASARVVSVGGIHIEVPYIEPSYEVSFSLAPYAHGRVAAVEDCYPNVGFKEHQSIGDLGTDNPATRAMHETLEAGFSFHLVALTDDCVGADLYTLVYITSDNS